MSQRPLECGDSSPLWDFRFARLTDSVTIGVQTSALTLPPLRVVSLPIGRPLAIKTKGFVFPRGAALRDFGNVPAGEKRHASPASSRRGPADDLASSHSPDATDAARRPARVKPPGDVIKLEDRLFYLLQPPLDAWMSRESLDFPFKPFPYQFEGVAFLYPRHAAVLADEMGLGKTMQAITAMRLLLHGGEVGSVLLVCPKPLVTNWQREFELWAPEVPVMVIEGDQAKRRWQWSLPCAVKIANYELLVRDRELLIEPPKRRSEGAKERRSGEVEKRGNQEADGDSSSISFASSLLGSSAPAFDLVVLDEAQRIKNRSSTTAQIVRAISRRRSWALTGTPIENRPTTWWASSSSWPRATCGRR